MKKILLFALALLSGSAYAAAPKGYYDACEGKSGKALLQALASTVSAHTNVGYDGLWNVYKDSDVRDDGSLWDIYTTKHWPSNFKQCGNYSLIGDCVNREHSFPKSWWGGGKSDQYSDAFHLYPTDGKVNGQRSNFPYGECASGTRLPANGSVQALGRLGTSTFAGYSGKVFEPDDEYKGDLARSYFYMAAAYNSKIASWSSDMLAGNNYPAFKTWAVNLLLKWSRQDAVSQKEIDRNEAIYKHQRNRNPFIDHPELVEYIWGNKQGVPWSSSGVVEPDIILPAEGTMVNLGTVAVGMAHSAKLTVKTVAMTDALSLIASGAGWSVSPTQLSAAQANAGAEVTITLNAAKAGNCAGVLSLVADDKGRQITLVATAIDGVPMTASEITSGSFTLNWENMHAPNAVNYTLTVSRQGTPLAGYPVQIKSTALTHQVQNLEPATSYLCTMEAPGFNPAQITVTTGELLPYIGVMFDGNLTLEAAPNTPSEPAELLLDMENITADINIAVKAPFELSTDKSGWTSQITLSPQEERFYLRLGAAKEGNYETDIVVSSGDYVNDIAEAKGLVYDHTAESWLEDFEFECADLGSYSAKTFTTPTCTWEINDGGFWPDADRSQCGGTTALRAGKTSTSTLTMLTPKEHGMGELTFDFRPYGTDGLTTIEVEYRADGTDAWLPVGQVNSSATSMENQRMRVNQPGNGYLRFRQTAGKRWFIDNISLGNYSSQSAVNSLSYHSWDAYGRNGQLIIEAESTLDVAIYDITGTCIFTGTIAAGEHSLAVPCGIYFVNSDGFTRRLRVH